MTVNDWLLTEHVSWKLSKTVNFIFAGSCDEALGMESGTIPDEAITASSSYVPNVGPRNGR